MTTTYAVTVDWNDDGDYSDTLEDLTSRVFARPGVVASRGRDQIRVLAPPAAGQAAFTVDNADNYLSPENTGSPIGSYLFPGHPMRIMATAATQQYDEASVPYDSIGLPYDGRSFALWSGVLDDIQLNVDIAQRTAQLHGLGILSKLAGKTVTTALYQDITTDVAIGYVLDAVGFSSTARRLSTGDMTLLWFWADGQDALSLILQLLAAEGVGASIYESGDGKLVFENRNYRSTAARSSLPTATFTGVDTEPVIAKGMKYSPNLKNILNVASCTVKTRAIAGSLSVVWSLGESLTFSAGQTRVFTARQSSSIPFTQAVTPVAATDYTVSAGAISSVSIDRTSGASVTITITAGGAGATVTGLQLRAKLVDVTNTTAVSNTTDASTSISRYGRRVYPLNIWPEISVNNAQDLVNSIVTGYKDLRATVEFSVVANDTNAARLSAILKRQLSDRITVNAAESYHVSYDDPSKTYGQASFPYDGAAVTFTADVFIERIEHHLSYNRHELMLGCEKTTQATYARWDAVNWNGAGATWGF